MVYLVRKREIPQDLAEVKQKKTALVSRRF